jgi:tRNA dimethylallyltransferase
MTRALLILGPTASGKSALALSLAKAVKGEIVNADSMQVYRDLRVLTARPSVEEEAQAPHHLYGFVDAAERFSVGRWLSAATGVLEDIRARGRTPIVVGGTGLYFKALTDGLVEVPEPPPEIRAEIQALRDAEGPEALHAALAREDPQAAATLGPRDAPRLARALEVIRSSAVPIGAWRERTQPTLPAGSWAGLALAPERPALYLGIDARFDAMLEKGALEEARTLTAKGLNPELPCMKAHGMPWLAAHLRGEISLAEAAEFSRRDTRRYAKRQFTWLAHQVPGWPRLAAPDPQVRREAALALLAEPV